MKENMELERKDLVIDRDMEVDCDIGQQITCYIETWFDVDKKFHIKTDSDNGTWLNMYGKYNPFADTLRIECVISGDDFSDSFDYQPSAAESQLIKDMITEKIREVHGQTPEEFCDSYSRPIAEKVFVYENNASLTVKKLTEKADRIMAHCEECGYLQSGSYIISVPMIRCGDEFRTIVDYCHSRGISKIVVDSFRDIGNISAETEKVISLLCGQGLSLEVIYSGQIYVPVKKEGLPDEDKGQGITIGGM